jgi:drug/metabolite transporter (DMT)-like permease
MNPHRLRAYFLLIIVSIIWALAGPIIKYTLGVLPPIVFLTYRFAISSIFGSLTLIFTGVHLPKNPKLWFHILIYSFFTSTLTLGLLFLGLEKTTVIDMSLISITGPLLITIAGVIFLKEHVTKREKIGLLIALGGMSITVIEPIIAGNGFSKFSGNFLIVLYLLANTVSIVYLKILLRQNVKPYVLTNISFIIGFISLLPIISFKYGFSTAFQDIRNLDLSYHIAVFFMAILSGNIAYTLSNKAHKTIEVGEASLFSYLYPILSIPLAVFWLKEKLTVIFIIGSIIILCGVFVAEFKKTRYNQA